MWMANTKSDLWLISASLLFLVQERCCVVEQNMNFTEKEEKSDSLENPNDNTISEEIEFQKRIINEQQGSKSHSLV